MTSDRLLRGKNAQVSPPAQQYARIAVDRQTCEPTDYLPSRNDSTMQCPFCHADNDRVIDSRAHQDGFAIRRRRECLGCKRRYTTYERAEESGVKVVKKDKAREPFCRDKMRRGLEKACGKRPVSEEQINGIVVAIENELHDSMETEIGSQQLGEMVMDHLRELDEVAYVRFASVYRQFKDVRDFVEELQPMLDGRQQPPR